MLGSIKTLTGKGYGFIKPDEGEKDIFFHAKKLEGVQYEDLNKGDRVEFEVEETDKGIAAFGVVRAV